MPKNITYENYLRLSEQSSRKPYAIRYKLLRTFFWLASFFGNGASIFFASFFLYDIFQNTVFNINTTSLIVAIIIFMSLFEGIKRYIFNIFSEEYMENKKEIWAKKTRGFLIATLVIVGVSFFFSIDGAQKLANRYTLTVATVTKNLKQETDSINNYYYDKYIHTLQNENKTFLQEISENNEQKAVLVRKGWRTDKFDQTSTELNTQINRNKDNIQKYEKERDQKIAILNQQSQTTLSTEHKTNQTNILYFLFLSTLIEIVILYGIYFNHDYMRKAKEEYERTIAQTSQFKKWKKCDEILDFLFENTDFQINQCMPTTASLQELFDINELNLSPKDLENCLKVLKHLNVYDIEDGNKRMLRKDKEETRKILRDYFRVL